ncbi:hypothetical protein A2961_03535 [Candidatus Woesebacteria bacterium RIFCSPLOWO2_01_FULL_39_21]|uniref:Uncharacterized protein n=1 Tax=Candidatus Woesebacteria bacterium RIFCSPLOWO2_01_FULL_39_21 TaxID=1802519 RepID=A0A1F8BJE9_9BACT|nr:MAG: hypothetical protein A2961_03535 [Candidatus Woesebacteria bacterium RIFCSPLOWO2_01_FULL_39_21]
MSRSGNPESGLGRGGPASEVINRAASLEDKGLSDAADAVLEAGKDALEAGVDPKLVEEAAEKVGQG